MNNTNTKQCGYCQQTKSYDDFSININSRDGYCVVCKQCQKEIRNSNISKPKPKRTYTKSERQIQKELERKSKQDQQIQTKIVKKTKRQLEREQKKVLKLKKRQYKIQSKLEKHKELKMERAKQKEQNKIHKQLDRLYKTNLKRIELFNDAIGNFDGEWKEIPLNENYIALSDGRIWSKTKCKFMSTQKHRGGYLFVCGRYFTPNNPKKRTQQLLHKMIALTFIPNPNNYRCVNHIDLQKDNNNVSNLEWCNHKQNITHAIYNGVKVGQKQNHKKYTTNEIGRFDDDGVLLQTYTDRKVIYETFGMHQTSLSQALTQGRKSKGYRWQYMTKDYIKSSRGCPVQKWNNNGELIATYPTITQAAASVNRSTQSIKLALDGKFSQSGGYIWKYAA